MVTLPLIATVSNSGVNSGRKPVRLILTPLLTRGLVTGFTLVHGTVFPQFYHIFYGHTYRPVFSQLNLYLTKANAESCSEACPVSSNRNIIFLHRTKLDVISAPTYANIN